MTGISVKKAGKDIGRFASILLFFVYLVCILFTILIGSRVYENIRARDDGTFCENTVLAYISNKVRMNDRQGAVRVRREEGIEVLVLGQFYGEEEYETWIYTKDGRLKELFSQKGSGISLEDGLDIMECGEVKFTLSEKGLLTVSVAGGRQAAVLLRSGQTGGKGT